MECVYWMLCMYGMCVWKFIPYGMKFRLGYVWNVCFGCCVCMECMYWMLCMYGMCVWKFFPYGMKFHTHISISCHTATQVRSINMDSFHKYGMKFHTHIMCRSMEWNFFMGWHFIHTFHTHMNGMSHEWNESN